MRMEVLDVSALGMQHAKESDLVTAKVLALGCGVFAELPEAFRDSAQDPGKFQNRR